MPLTVSWLGVAVAAAVILGSTFPAPASAYAARRHYSAHYGVGITDPGAFGGDLRWGYGPSIAWYRAYRQCYLREPFLIDRRAPIVRGIYICPRISARVD